MEKKISVSKIPGSLNLKFTFQFDHSSKASLSTWLQLATTSLDNTQDWLHCYILIISEKPFG